MDECNDSELVKDLEGGDRGLFQGTVFVTRPKRVHQRRPREAEFGQVSHRRFCDTATPACPASRCQKISRQNMALMFRMKV
jgi:hypothetical protein